MASSSAKPAVKPKYKITQQTLNQSSIKNQQPKNEKMSEEKQREKMTFKDKVNAWIDFWEWKNKEDGVGVKTHPFTTGWYPTKRILDKKTYRSKILPSYWDGKDWKPSTDINDKPLNNVYAYVATYSSCREECEVVCDRYNTDIEVVRYD